jgi:hypothetical protein
VNCLQACVKYRVGQLADDAFQIALAHDAEQIATTTADVLDVLQRRVSRHESPEAALAFEVLRAKGPKRF